MSTKADKPCMPTTVYGVYADRGTATHEQGLIRKDFDSVRLYSRRVRAVGTSAEVHLLVVADRRGEHIWTHYYGSVYRCAECGASTSRAAS